MKQVRIELDGDATWGRLDDDGVIATAAGRELDAADAIWLPPVMPTKIIAVHLTYRSRLEEYAVARVPTEPSYFMKPTTTLNAPPRADLSAGWRALSQLRGRAGRDRRESA